MDATAEALAHDTCLEFELPRGAIAKAVAKWFDGVGKDDRVHAAIARAGGLFSLYLTAAAVQICKDNKRQTISPQDVLGTAAASLLNFPDDIPESLPYLKEQLKEQEAAKAAEAAKASTPA
ncbi:hypothetical protein JL720_3301 [Aureococcus anophagefferens]|nr:hypothetical protein JL720_3301 [Aureococcus anophagefferens]